MFRFSLVTALALLTSTLSAEQITVLGINDMHANILAMPRLDTLVQQERKADPELLLMAAGDNRTGDPYCDSHARPGWPMVALMNKVGFNLSTLGNHEFDGTVDSLRDCVNSAEFRHVCANVYAPDKLRLHVEPYKIFERKGVKIGVIGLIQLGENGLPDAHPGKLAAYSFRNPFEVVREYAMLRDHCDILILLTHMGFEDDLKLAEIFPEADAIIGGHTHTRVEKGVLANGVLITQAENKVKYVTRLTFEVEDGRVVSKKSELLSTEGVAPDPECEKLLKDIMKDPSLSRTLAVNEATVPTRDALGCMMADAYREETGCQIAFQNRGGVRVDVQPAGPLTVGDVYRMDPFRNEIIIVNLKGSEIVDLIEKLPLADHYGLPAVAGLSYHADITPENHTRVTKITLDDGTPLQMETTYSVALNSYVFSTTDFRHEDAGVNTGEVSEDLIIRFLERKKSVNYSGARRVFENKVDSL